MIIYKATFPNNKCYIGCTIFSLNSRKRCHKHKSLKRNSQTLFHKAIRKYGWNNIIWEELYYTSEHSNLLEMEQYFIKEFKTKVPFGYNLTDGGEGTIGHPGWSKGKKLSKEHCEKNRISKKSSMKPVIVVDTKLKTITEYESCSEVAKKLNITYSIVKQCRQYSRSYFHFKIFAKENFILADDIFKIKGPANSKEIQLTNGLCVLKFDSIADATRRLNLTEKKLRYMIYQNKEYNGWRKCV